MIYLLDTNACIVHLTNNSSLVSQRLASKSPRDIRLCSIVKAEMYYGVYKSQRRAINVTTVNTFFSQFHSLPFDDLAAEIAGRERARLAAVGTPIGPNDLLIAAIGLAHQATVVTHNTREFSRVVGLQIEDWEI